jgi:hypothetical protein
VKENKSGDGCRAGFLAPDWRKEEAESDFTIWFGVSRPSATPPREAGEHSSSAGVTSPPATPDSTLTTNAGTFTPHAIAGPDWKGSYVTFDYRSHAEDGPYQGIGNGVQADIIGPDGVQLHAEAHSWYTTHGGMNLVFDEMLCSLRFDGRAQGE